MLVLLAHDHLSAVYRVNWLRTKAQLARWIDERDLIFKEMTWTVDFYRSRAAWWRSLRSENSVGHAAYAARQAAMWDDMAEHAARQFANVR